MIGLAPWSAVFVVVNHGQESFRSELKAVPKPSIIPLNAFDLELRTFLTIFSLS